MCTESCDGSSKVRFANGLSDFCDCDLCLQRGDKILLTYLLQGIKSPSDSQLAPPPASHSVDQNGSSCDLLPNALAADQSGCKHAAPDDLSRTKHDQSAHDVLRRQQQQVQRQNQQQHHCADGAQIPVPPQSAGAWQQKAPLVQQQQQLLQLVELQQQQLQPVLQQHEPSQHHARAAMQPNQGSGLQQTGCSKASHLTLLVEQQKRTMDLLQQHDLSAAMSAVQQQQRVVTAVDRKLQREVFSLNMQHTLINTYVHQQKAQRQQQQCAGKVAGASRCSLARPGDVADQTAQGCQSTTDKENKPT